MRKTSLRSLRLRRTQSRCQLRARLFGLRRHCSKSSIRSSPTAVGFRLSSTFKSKHQRSYRRLATTLKTIRISLKLWFSITILILTSMPYITSNSRCSNMAPLKIFKTECSTAIRCLILKTSPKMVFSLSTPTISKPERTLITASSA